MRRSSPWCCALAALVFGCSQPERGGTTVARIDNTALTLEEVRAQFDSAAGVSDAQLQQYIQRWMNDELLFAEARKRNLHQTPEIDARVNDIRRRLAIQALLDQEIYNTATTHNAVQEIREYFEAHQSEFVLTHDAVLVSFVLMNSRDAATEFRNAVLRGNGWTKTVADVLTGSDAARVVAIIDSTYYTQATLAPQELWRVATNIKEGEPSFPVSTTNGYYILIPWKLMRQGQIPEIGFIRNEIEQRLTVERRRRKYEGLLANLRASHTVEVFVSGVPSSTSTSGTSRDE